MRWPWGGHELKYPKEDDVTDWQNLYSFTDYVMNSSNADFVENIWTKFSYKNYLDYFIFLNLLRATDNRGKNIYLAKYKTDEVYFYVPWDLDGCFGTDYRGVKVNITDDILDNGFYRRVIRLNPQNYSTSIANKWFDYRDNILKTEKLIESFENTFQFLSDNKVYEREAIVHSNYQYNQQELDYLLTWLQNRLSYLDNYFSNSLSINNIDLGYTKGYVYPNPANDIVYLKNINNLENKTYKIYDLLGRLIDQGKITDNSIHIEELKQGNYIIVLNNKSYNLSIQ